MLWPFQTVIIKGKWFCLTRLGFVLNVAPLVTKSVITTIGFQDQEIRRATSTYVDNIFINESIDSAVREQQHSRLRISL